MSAKPVLLATNLVAPDRVAPFRELHARVGLELALFGGRSHHATAAVDDPGVPHRHTSQRAVARLAASGRYAAVIAGTAGRTALPAAYLGARASRTPFVLWTALWDHPRTPAFRLAGTPLLEHLYRHADAVVTYGPHVTDFVRRQGARRVFEAPQAVDAAFWRRDGPRADDGVFRAIHVGRDAAYKGVDVLLDAWRLADLGTTAELVLVGTSRPSTPPGVRATGAMPPMQVRNSAAAADVLVLPALATPDFREPWGLVANEAMHLGLPVIATDAVGAAAGGLVRHERNGLVVPSGDAPALAAALRRLRDDRSLRERLGAAAQRDVAPYTPAAWAAGVTQALAAATTTRSPSSSL
ncbi:glycosyltransferase family 4 protein [Conexibacter sp. SYSU D00693]|uniref:glycosyltransferase family 4 protein n=1 Tax=Conexibacter sp. SYSU D00693 TaxID=2812560 RepID=UPI00196A7A51|nr:glycosyltransferase family 4 protein [Conexibacter sp. SYSU D00693]